MTVKTYGANANLALDGTGISGTDIAEEYGGNDQANVKLSDYYAGGSLVPSGTTGNPGGGSASAIPSSGQISFNNFFASTGVATFPSGTYYGRTGTPGTDSSTYVSVLGNDVESHSFPHIAVSNANTHIRIYTSSGAVEIQLKRGILPHTMNAWYNTSNVSQGNLSSTAWVTIWQMNVQPDSVRWSLNNYTNNSGTWISLAHDESNLSGVTSQLTTSYQTVSTSITLGRGLTTGVVTSGSNSATADRKWGASFDFRKSGYTDATGHAEFVFYHNCSAASFGSGGGP